MINKKKKGGMAKRYESSYANRDGGGSSKGGAVNYRKYDGEVTFFSPSEGKHRINIIPYVIKSKNHPLVKSGEAEIGEKDYVLDFYTHRSVGPSEKTVLCLKNTFGKPCPICEHAASLRKAGKEKEANALKPSRRVVYNIEDLKEPGKLKVFETSHFLFEKELIEEARDDDEGGFVDFADEDEGMEIKFRATKVKKGDMEFMEYKSFAFEDRDEKLDEKLLDSAISFDELLEVPSYEEVEKTLYGDDDEEDEDEKPKKKSKPKYDDEDDDDEESGEDEDDEEDEPKKSSKSKSKSDDEDEDEEDDDDEEDEKPKSKSKSKSKYDDDEDDENDDEPAPKKAAKKSKVEDEDDEDDDDEKPKSKSKSKSDDDEDEEDKPKKNCGKDCPGCPHGHKFGKDCDEFSDCDDCNVWDKCVKANE